MITAKLVDKSGSVVPANITLSLVVDATSMIPGRYTNHDPASSTYDSGPDFVAVASGANTITIESRDYGGKTVVSASVVYNGTPLTAELRIPKDSDGDSLPDAWELLYGLDPLRADTDGDGKLDKDEDEDASVNGASTGDRMVAFAEYRGVMWNGQHKRLDPTKKQLFVCGVDFAPGLFGFGNAFANAGIELLTIETKSNGANWSNFVKNFEDTKLDVLIIRSYPDGWSAGDYNTGHIRWIGVRKFDIPILGESYFGNSTQYGQPTKIYARSIGNYFNDRPYVDHSNYLPNILQMLDPLSKLKIPTTTA